MRWRASLNAILEAEPGGFDHRNAAFFMPNQKIELRKP
jgi:hypothetical protein